MLKLNILPSFLTACICSLPLYAGAAHAQMIDYGSFEMMFEEPVTTSATGQPQRMSDVPLNMEIVTADEIRRSGAKQIPDVLRKLAGINVRQYTETQTEVGIRGYNNAFNDLILVLINGRQVYIDFYGYIAWDSLPIQMAEIRQIEVVKGPNTSLFGFNAVSGVINIVTYNPQYDDINVATAAIGTQGYNQAGLVDTMRLNDKFSMRYSLSTEDVNEYSDTPIAGQKLGSALPPAIRQKGSGRKTGNVMAVYQHDDVTQFGFEYSNVQSNRNEVATSVYTHTNYAQRAYKFNFSRDSGKFGLWEGSFYKNELEANNLKVDYNEVWVAQLSNTFKVGPKHSFRLMGEYRDNRSDQISLPDSGPLSFGNNRVQYDIASASAMWNWNVNRQFTLNNSLRYDVMNFDIKGVFNPIFFGALTEADYDRREVKEASWNSNIHYRHDDQNTVRFSYGHGVDVPSFAEFSIMLLDPTIPPAGLGFMGNPNVPVATVDSYDLTYDHDFIAHDMSLRASVFHQKFQDVQAIEAFDPLNPRILQYGNGGDTQSTGVELGLKGKAIDRKMDWGMNYAFVKVQDDPNPGFTISKAAPSGNVEAEDGYPVSTLSGWLGYETDQWELDGSFTYYDSYTDVLPQLITNAPYHVSSEIHLNAHMAYEFQDGVSVALTGRGIQGERYEAGTQKIEPEVFLSTTVDLGKAFHKMHKERNHPF